MLAHSSDLALAPATNPQGADTLTQVLLGLRLDGVEYGRCQLRAPWAIAFPAKEEARFHFVAEGNCWLRTPSSDWVHLNPGDAVLLPRGSSHILASAPDLPTVGEAFRFRNERAQKRELIIFLTARIVRRADETCRLAIRREQQPDLGTDPIGLGGDIGKSGNKPEPNNILGITYDDLNTQAAALPPGSEGLVVLDHFQGNRTPYTDPNSRGAITGLTLRHGPAHIFRAMMEGVAFGTELILETMGAAGFTPEGLPIGLQIVGRHQDDFGVLQLAHAFEQATQSWKQRPPVVWARHPFPHSRGNRVRDDAAGA